MVEEQLSREAINRFTDKLARWSTELSSAENHFLGEILARALNPYDAEASLALDYSHVALESLERYAERLTT